MALLFSVICFVSLAVIALANEGPCFQFEANSYIHFSPNVFNNNNSIHYSLKFKTTEDNGIILYGHGSQGDEEALFVRDGKLVYHLFNTDATGVGANFGGYFQTEEIVNTGEWITAHVYRMWNVTDVILKRTRSQTGIIVEINGQQHRYLDYWNRGDINIVPMIYFGGYREELSTSVGYFKGQIKDIREEKNSHLFEEPSLNYMSKVLRTCDSDLVVPDPL